MYMSWKQKCEEERFFYIIVWEYTGNDDDPYIRKRIAEELTEEEAKELFDSIDVDSTYEQVEIWQEFSEEDVDKIALKAADYETWDRDEM